MADRHPYQIPKRTLSDQEITELIKLATLAPSAFNLQNCRLVAVRSEAAKMRLLPLTYGQQKVEDSAVTFIDLRRAESTRNMTVSLQLSLDAGIIDKATYDTWVGAAQAMYADNPQLQCDEGIRSGSSVSKRWLIKTPSAHQDTSCSSSNLLGECDG